MNEYDEIEVGEESMILAQDLELPSVAIVEARVEQYSGILKALLRLTKPQDWVRFASQGREGQPARVVYRLDGFGTRRLIKPLGVSIVSVTKEKIVMEDDKGPYYLWIYSGIARLGRGEIYVEGRASSRDKFFGVKGGELRPLSEVSQRDIMTAAYHDLLKKAITEPLGIGNYTLRDLEDLGFDVSELQQGYTFRDSGKAADKKPAGQPPKAPQGPAPTGKPTAKQEAQGPMPTDMAAALTSFLTKNSIAISEFERWLVELGWLELEADGAHLAALSQKRAVTIFNKPHEFLERFEAWQQAQEAEGEEDASDSSRTE